MHKRLAIVTFCVLSGCAAQQPAPTTVVTRTVPAKCTACHLAPAEHSLPADRWDRYLKNHKRRLRISDEEKAFLYDFLVGKADLAGMPGS